MIKLLGIGFDDDSTQVGGILKRAVVKHESWITSLRLIKKMGDIAGSEPVWPMHQAVDFVALFQKQFGEIRTVLPRDARDERPFHATTPNRCSQHGKNATGKMAGIMGTLLATENAAVVQRETLQDTGKHGRQGSLAGEERFRKLQSRFGVPFVVRLDIPDSPGAVFHFLKRDHPF